MKLKFFGAELDHVLASVTCLIRPAICSLALIDIDGQVLKQWLEQK